VDLKKPLAILMAGFDYAFVRLTEGWPSKFCALGQLIEDILLHYDSGPGGERVLIIPPIAHFFSPWLTFYNTAGDFASVGLSASVPFRPKLLGGIAGDIVISLGRFSEDGTNLTLEPEVSNQIYVRDFHRDQLAFRDGGFLVPSTDQLDKVPEVSLVHQRWERKYKMLRNPLYFCGDPNARVISAGLLEVDTELEDFTILGKGLSQSYYREDELLERTNQLVRSVVSTEDESHKWW